MQVFGLRQPTQNPSLNTKKQQSSSDIVVKNGYPPGTEDPCGNNKYPSICFRNYGQNTTDKSILFENKLVIRPDNSSNPNMTEREDLMTQLKALPGGGDESFLLTTEKNLDLYSPESTQYTAPKQELQTKNCTDTGWNAQLSGNMVPNSNSVVFQGKVVTGFFGTCTKPIPPEPEPGKVGGLGTTEIVGISGAALVVFIFALWAFSKCCGWGCYTPGRNYRRAEKEFNSIIAKSLSENEGSFLKNELKTLYWSAKSAFDKMVKADSTEAKIQDNGDYKNKLTHLKRSAYENNEPSYDDKKKDATCLTKLGC